MRLSFAIDLISGSFSPCRARESSFGSRYCSMKISRGNALIGSSGETHARDEIFSRLLESNLSLLFTAQPSLPKVQIAAISAPVDGFQNRMVVSSPTEINVLPSRLKMTNVTQSE